MDKDAINLAGPLMQPRTPWWQWLTAAGVLLWIGSGAAVAQVPVVGAQSAVGWDEDIGSTLPTPSMAFLPQYTN